MRSDFVKVKLTEHGEQLAGGNEVVVIHGQHEFRFKPGETRDDITLAFDWERILSKEMFDGKPLFELVSE